MHHEKKKKKEFEQTEMVWERCYFFFFSLTVLPTVFVSPDGRIGMFMVYNSLMGEHGGIPSVPDKTESTLGILRMILIDINRYHHYVFFVCISYLIAVANKLRL